ncbi:MAG: tRNA lysidine(34) synthetase TilS, partial [Chloroflexota bacterium]
VLMHVLHRLQRSFDCSAHVVTVDHGWRGAESAADAAFVVEQAERLGLPVTAGKLELSADDTGLEAVARRARYDYFAAVAATTDTDTVAVAHHADDQAETVLMHLLRGSGLRGLAGMGWVSHVPYHPKLRLIRPLLGVTRAEIEAYCTENDLHPRHDPTNDDVTFLRNHIRHEMLPYMEDFNPNIKKALVRLADVASADEDYMQQQVETLAMQYTARTDSQIRFPRDEFVRLHPAIQTRLLIHLATQLYTPQVPDLDYEHIVAARYVCLNGKQGAVAQLLAGGRIRMDYNDMVFEFEQSTHDWSDAPALSVDQRVKVTLETPIKLKKGTILLTEGVPSEFTVLGKMYLPSDQDLYLRPRQNGDRVLPPGMDGRSRKLSQWMIDRKIPAYQRSSVPLLATGQRIIAALHIEKGAVFHPHHRPAPGFRHLYIGYKI